MSGTVSKLQIRSPLGFTYMIQTTGQIRSLVTVINVFWSPSFGYSRLGKPQACVVRSLAKRSGISKGQKVEAHPGEEVQWRVGKVVSGGFEYIVSGKVWKRSCS